MEMIKFLLAIAVILVAFGYVGEQDYQIKQATACEAKGGNWDGQSCLKTFRVERKCK